MKKVKVAITGLGNVGRRFVSLLESKAATLREDYGLDLRLVSAIDLMGTVSDPLGIAPGSLTALPFGVEGILSHPDVTRGLSGRDAIEKSGADVLVEATPTNVKTGEPGLTHFRAAIGAGMHVVTLAKGPLVVDWPGVTALARSKGVEIKFSGATAAALPTIDVAQYCLAGMNITGIMGIFNGTTNYILTRMHEAGIDYTTGLKEAQEMGIAEPDPTLDVEGLDTAAKILILANAVLGAGIRLEDLEVEGITRVSTDDVAGAKKRGKIIKLIGEARPRADGGVEASVGPVAIHRNHPLAQVNQSNKAVAYDSEEMGELIVMGGKSDPGGAAAAALKDLVNLARAIQV